MAKFAKDLPGSARPVQRTFSTALKKKLVKDYENNLITVIQVSRRYEVSSGSVYKWIRRFSNREVGIRQVVEMESEEFKTARLEQQLDEALRLAGQQQLLLNLQSKIIAHVSEEVGYDVKKKYEPLFSKSSVRVIKENTP